MLIYDAPPPVGYSYCGDDVAGDGYSCGDWDDYRAARAAHAFVENWLAEFPAFGHNKLFLSGESYAGVCAVFASPVAGACLRWASWVVSVRWYLPSGTPVCHPTTGLGACDTSRRCRACPAPANFGSALISRPTDPIRLSLPRASACYRACWYPCVSP